MVELSLVVAELKNLRIKPVALTCTPGTRGHQNFESVKVGRRYEQLK